MKTTFFQNDSEVIAVQSKIALNSADMSKLTWLLKATPLTQELVAGTFIGPRKEVLSPWSTNATDIARNVGIDSIVRMEQFAAVAAGSSPVFDPMVEAVYPGLDQTTLVVERTPEPTKHIDDIAEYNRTAGLALSDEEIGFLEVQSKKLGRKFTDAEVYGFSQINSEHCRHKIFNGEFVIDGAVKPKSLFGLIKDTAKAAPDNLVSAYKDNVAFIKGPAINHFAPMEADCPSQFKVRPFDTVLSLKAETHNFPTTVEPFYGASTGGGGEIRDRMAGGQGSFPLAGTAVYMTSYSRLTGSRGGNWEKNFKERTWKYQTPAQILIKASNGASDFGNKFGQPLICGSVLTFEGGAGSSFTAFDRCIMLAGGIGFARAEHAEKLTSRPKDALVVLGGDNYRIGMAGGSVSSVATGAYSKEIELSAVQRANPEMQKRVYNAIRSLCEMSTNPIRLIHDHGAGGHVNCFSELLEAGGGKIELARLPVGDPTLSAMEIMCNESQERMGLLVAPEDVPLLQRIADRECAPMYVVGEVANDGRIVFEAPDGSRPMDLPLEVLFGSSPKLRIEDATAHPSHTGLEYSIETGQALLEALQNVLSLEAVACKDWLTNKVDRCVTGLVAQQQCVGPLQVPLADYGIMSLEYSGANGVATAIGHAPVAGLIDPQAGAVLSVSESLTNILGAPLAGGIESIALSANWMWPARQSGEDARLYAAVQALSEFCIALGVAVPTGKDSLSMTMKYSDGQTIKAPGTVIVSAAAQTARVYDTVTPDLKHVQGSQLLYVDLSGNQANPLGGSSFAQSLGQVGHQVPQVDAATFKRGFAAVREAVVSGKILALHDISSGGLLSACCEMAFAGDIGIALSFQQTGRELIEQLFSEKPSVVLQVLSQDVAAVTAIFSAAKIPCTAVGEVKGTQVRLHASDWGFTSSLADLRRTWFKQSFLLDSKQTKPALAKERYERFDAHPLSYTFPEGFTGNLESLGIDLLRSTPSGIRAAVIRDKGTNGEREAAISLFAAGFDVRDVTTTDLISGRETLEDVNFVVFPGGFSCSDVLGSGIGWAGAFKYNEQAQQSLRNFFKRPDTMSLGICNGCQLVVALDLVRPEHNKKMQMLHNESGKFESTFVGVRVLPTSSIMLQPLTGCELGIWVAHGEGRFSLPEGEQAYDIPLKFVSSDYPANPNGSDFNAAAVCSADGRHLVMMPHLERSMFGFNWPYPGVADGAGNTPHFEISPWILAFQAAFAWCKAQA